MTPAASQLINPDILTPDAEWMKFLAGLCAVLLTFLAGAELDPVSIYFSIEG